jgi:hypothetical protein
VYYRWFIREGLRTRNEYLRMSKYYQDITYFSLVNIDLNTCVQALPVPHRATGIPALPEALDACD